MREIGPLSVGVRGKIISTKMGRRDHPLHGAVGFGSTVFMGKAIEAANVLLTFAIEQLRSIDRTLRVDPPIVFSITFVLSNGSTCLLFSNKLIFRSFYSTIIILIENLSNKGCKLCCNGLILIPHSLYCVCECTHLSQRTAFEIGVPFQKV